MTVRIVDLVEEKIYTMVLADANGTQHQLPIDAEVYKFLSTLPGLFNVEGEEVVRSFNSPGNVDIRDGYDRGDNGARLLEMFQADGEKDSVEDVLRKIGFGADVEEQSDIDKETGLMKVAEEEDGVPPL